MGYRDGEVIGWCSIAPRASHARLNRSRSIPQLEGGNVWSIVCFYLDRRVQNQGLSYKFLRAAVEHAAAQGADAVEGYPVEPEYDENGNWNPATSYRFMGYRSTFERAGFRDVTPDGSGRTIMRIEF